MHAHDVAAQGEPAGVQSRGAPACVGHRLEEEADRFADRYTTSRPVAVRPAPPFGTRPGPPVGSAGVPLDAATRVDMEPRLGWDLSQVRVHTGREARESAAALGAQAYTAGRHVVLGAGAPEPGARRQLLAHELMHVAQQARGEGRGMLHLKRDPAAAARRRRKPVRFPVHVTHEMGASELLSEFVRQYYEASSEQEVDRRLPFWHWTKGPGRAVTTADARRGVVVLNVTDVTQGAVDRMSEAEKEQVNTEADERFWQEAGLERGTMLGLGPQDAALRRRWLGARADVVHEHEQLRQIAELPDDIKKILFAGDRPVAAEDYDTVLLLAQKLSGLTKAQRMDYLSKVNSATASWTEMDASIGRFMLGERIRESESVRTDAAAATLFGCEDLYRVWKDRNRLRLEAAASALALTYSPGRRRELDEANNRVEVALARHGFATESAFLTAMETYRLRFQAEAVQLGLDILARYDHLLYEERGKLQNLDYVRQMVAGIAATAARRDYAAAEEEEDLAGLLQMGTDPETPTGRTQFAGDIARHRMHASSLRASASGAVVAGSGPDPLVDPMQLGRGTDQEKLAGLDATGAQSYLLDVLGERLTDTGKARAEFTEHPDRIFSQLGLVEATKKSQNLADTIYAWIVDDYLAEQRAAHVFSAVVQAIIAVVLAVLVPGGGWVAAAALIAGAGMSTYQAIEAIQEYRQQGVQYRLAFIDEQPQLAWVVVAVAAAALDLGVATTTLLKTSAKGLSALEVPLREFAAASDLETAAARYETLVTRIREAEGLDQAVKDAMEVRLAAEMGLKRAFGRAGGSLLGVAGAVDPTPLLEVLYYGIRKGATSITKLRKDAQLLELMGDVTKLTGAGKEELTSAFEQVKEVVKVAKGRQMDEATALRFVDRLAEERSAGEGAFEALLEDMKEWRRPTLEQVQAESRLSAASEQLASLRNARAELAAELHAARQAPSGTRDVKQIKKLEQELAEYDDLFARSPARELKRQGLITRAEHELRTAEALAEAASVEPTTRMRQVFAASAEREEIVTAATVDQVGSLRTPAKGLEVDHVVSLRRMSQMQGFDKLKAIERNALAIRKDNLVLMDASANASKGERGWSAWSQASTFYGPDDIAKWIDTDRELTKTIQEWIITTVRGR